MSSPYVQEKWEATEKEFLDLRIVFSLAPIQIEKYIRRIFFTLLASAFGSPEGVEWYNGPSLIQEESEEVEGILW